METEGAYRRLSQEAFEDIASRILYEDNHLIVINKRAGEIVQGDKTGDEALSETLKAFIAQRNSKPGKVFMGVPHRLDRPVSGICVFAKTSKALERMNELFRNGGVKKCYYALCCKDKSAPFPPVSDEFTLLENHLLRNEKQNKTYVVKAGTQDAKCARLKYRICGHTKSFVAVEVELLTGRHHQIRCQLSNIGLYIKGDLKYGAPRSNPDGGICLMARTISFIHPVSKKKLDIQAPIPEDWPQIESKEEN